MAGNEVPNPTQLYTGWSSVVHQPFDDFEETDLPSTVDITAFSSALSTTSNVNANLCNDNKNVNNGDSEVDSSNSGSEASHSGSQSDSSDSETSSSTADDEDSSSSSPSPEFSVTSSQTDGLRLTIASIKKFSSPTNPSEKSPKAKKESSSESDKSSSENERSNSSSRNRCGKEQRRITRPAVKNRETRKTDARKREMRVKKRVTRRSGNEDYSMSESDDNASILASSCSLQEIRQEDLAAILPDQQECDVFGTFEKDGNKKHSPQEGDISDSEMELPQQAVNALIERTTESSSDNEERDVPNPNSLYSNSLLRQFEAQTQMLSVGNVTIGGVSKQTQNFTKVKDNQITHEISPKSGKNESDDTKNFRRGRSSRRKQTVTTVQTAKADTSQKVKSNKNPYGLAPNVSPDSGIPNSPDHISSPEHILNKNLRKEIRKDEIKKSAVKKDLSKSKAPTEDKNKRLHKLSMTSDRFDRQLYGHSDRILYPPRRKASRVPKKNSLRHHKAPASQKITPKPQKDNKIDKTEAKKPSKVTLDKPAVDKTAKNAPVNVTQKPKSLFLFEICEKVSKRLEQNKKLSENRPGRSTKTVKTRKSNQKIPPQKIETKSFSILKNAKVVHNKHCHKRHKKCKLTIIRPASAINNNLKDIDLEKLVTEFNQLNISNNVLKVKENQPEILKNVKKVSKKRKTNEFERKKKKQNVNTTVNKAPSSNEQRLPLKKRHYHLSATDNKDDEIIDKKSLDEHHEIAIDKNKNVSGKVSVIHKSEKPKTANPIKTDLPKSPKVEARSNSLGSPKSSVKSEEKSSKKDKTHSDETCAKFNKNANKNEINASKGKDSKVPQSSSVLTTATTPKKRHRLAAISPELDNLEDKTPADLLSKDEKKPETSMEQVVTELKLKRNLSPKNQVSENKVESEVQIITRKKNRLEDLTLNLVSKINPNFENDRKKKITESTRSSVIKYPACKKAKPTELEKLNAITSDKPTGIFMPTVEIEDLKNVDVKRDVDLLPSEDKIDDNKHEVPSTNQKTQVQSPDSKKKKVRKRRAINRTGFPTVKKKKKIVQIKIEVTSEPVELSKGAPNASERVPLDGEEYTSFLQRTESDTKIKPEEMSPAKWETMSECDSLPQDERTEIELDDMNTDSNSSRPFSRDDSPALSVSTLASDVSKTKDDYLDDLPLETRLKNRRKRSSDLRESYARCSKKKSGNAETKSAEDKERPSDKNKKVPKWKKKYLVAGLFSDYFKEDQESRPDMSTKPKNLPYDPKEHPHGLLPPPYHCGRYLRTRKHPFQLPYDIWWRHEHNQIQRQQSDVPSWNYKKIRTNVYNVKQLPPACDPQNCSCDPSNDCGDDCLNRLVYAECPASHRCKNQRIQKHEWSPGLEKFMTEDKGWGVRTKLPIKSGEFILEYVGEVVADQVFKERMNTIYVNDTHHYCLYLDSGTVIDGHRMGGDGRFVNHSCEPNCEMQKWSVNGHFRMALFALRDITGGEELTYDYNFSLFNPAEGQECKCGSNDCRGVIGGKSQRVRAVVQEPTEKPRPNRVGRPRKTIAKKSSNNGAKDVGMQAVIPPPSMSSIIRPLSHQQKLYILEHRCFLLRNIRKVRNAKDRSVTSSYINRQLTPSPTELVGASFLNHLNALEKPRNMKTRRIAQAEDNPDLNRSIKLAAVFKDIWSSVTNYKDENDTLNAIPLMNLPSKRKSPQFYQAIENPIDFSTIGQHIAKGVYRTTESFDADMNRVFSNYVKFYGHDSDIGLAAVKLKKVYNEVKTNNLHKFEDVLGQKPPSTFASRKGKNDEEDIIRCICGMYHDEGLMIQCEKCLVWQHSECVKADASAPSYHCEKCAPREVDYEIAMDEFTEHGHRYYMTLMRGDLQIRQGDTVYVLRDIPIPGTNLKHTYKTIGSIDFSELDIFRVERLWKDKDTGLGYAYGHHYLRPHETYHEPTRKFFPNEVMRVPLYEAVPMDLIMSRCWVMDLHTYCKGRPIGAPEEHIYICEYRVDKSARLFHKVSKAKFSTCTKSYVFEKFAERLKISRTYAPHELDERVVKPKGKIKQADVPESHNTVKIKVLAPPKPKNPVEQKNRLNKILLNLLSKLPSKQPLDLSYLLEDSRRRKTKIKTKRS